MYSLRPCYGFHSILSFPLYCTESKIVLWWCRYNLSEGNTVLRWCDFREFNIALLLFVLVPLVQGSPFCSQMFCNECLTKWGDRWFSARLSRHPSVNIGYHPLSYLALGILVLTFSFSKKNIYFPQNVR